VPVAAAPAPIVTAPVATPVAAAQKASVLGATLRFKGDLTADEDLVIEGQVEGSVLHTRSLTIGSQGHVRGHIRARRVIVEGKVDGNVYALESVTLRAGATLQGDVFARRVSIESGARVSGRVDMDNAPAVPKIDTLAVDAGSEDVRELSDQEVGALLSNS
jgi:cytoskeletal protein CcmA (bactofilin family)